MFKAVPGQRTVELFWSNLSADINYTLSCAISLSPSFLSRPISHTQSSVEIEDLSPNTMHSCAIVANSTFSPAFTSFTTLEDCMAIKLNFLLNIFLCRFILSTIYTSARGGILCTSGSKPPISVNSGIYQLAYAACRRQTGWLKTLLMQYCSS